MLSECLLQGRVSFGRRQLRLFVGKAIVLEPTRDARNRVLYAINPLNIGTDFMGFNVGGLL